MEKSIEKPMETPQKKKTFLGQPLGITIASCMQMTAGFAKYGMSSILIYYLYLQTTKGGLGFDQNTAAQLTSVYTALSLMAGVLGGFVADRFIGLQKALMGGYFLLTLGYALLAIPGGGVPLYLASQVILLAAFGTMGSSLNALAGKLYSKDDPRRDAGFGMMYILNNVGAVAPMITGGIALATNYHFGFLTAAIIQGCGFLLYLISRKSVFGDLGLQPDDPIPAAERKQVATKFALILGVTIAALVVLFITGILTPRSFSNIVSVASIFLPFAYFFYIIRSEKTSQKEATRVKSFVFLFISISFTAMIWSQSTSILAIYAAERVNLSLLGINFSPASFQTVPAVLAIIFGIFTSWLWLKMKNNQPTTSVKFGLGTILYGFGPIFMAIPFTLFNASVKVSPLWLFMFYVFIIFGEALTSPVGVAAASKLSPKAFSAQMMTIWQLTGSTGAGLSALAVNFYHPGSEAIYFIGIGTVTCLVGLAVWLSKRRLDQMMS